MLNIQNPNLDKMAALAVHCECEIEDIAGYDNDSCMFQHDANTYMVLTDVEADDCAYESIYEDMWAIHPTVIDAYTTVSYECIELLQTHHEECNEALISCITDMDELVNDLVADNGRSMYISGDHFEHVIGDYFIYRTE